MNKVKAVIIGFAHMHVNEVAQYIDKNDFFELCGLADVPPDTPEKTESRYTRAWNLKNNSKKYKLTPYEDFRVMLEEIEPDIAFILCDNLNKPYIAEECAKRGIDICIEKPMAISLKDALEIRQTVEKYGINAVVNWPVIWRPYIHEQLAVLNSGIVGRLIKCYYINGHTGPLGKGAKHRGVDEKADNMTDEERASTWWYKSSAGGGVVLDIGCYGCFFNEWARNNRIDKPMYVTAFSGNYNTPYMDAPDNMAAIIEYRNSYGVIEGTWTMPQGVLPTGPIYACENGVIYCDNDRKIKVMDIYGEEIKLPEYKIMPHIADLPDHYAYCMNKGFPLIKSVTLDFNVQVMAVLDAVLKSAKSGMRVKVDVY